MALATNRATGDTIAAADINGIAAAVNGLTATGWLNVKDYGAVGNGTTNDTTAIQSALDAVPTNGGTVYFPAGDYLVTSTLLGRRENLRIIGSGTGNVITGSQGGYGTRIRIATGFTGTAVLRIARDLDDRPLHSVHLRDFTIDVAGVGAGIDGLHYKSNRGLIDNIHVWRATGSGVHMHGYTTWNLYDTIVRNIQVFNSTAAGFWIDTGATDLHIFHCIFAANQDNMLFTGGSSAQVTGCHFYDGQRHNIYFNGNGSRTKFANCKIEGSQDHGVNIDSTVAGYSDLQFTGCNFANNGENAATTYDHFIIQGPSTAGIGRTMITGCAFSTKSGGVTPRYFINLASGAAQNTMIVGNSFTTPGTGRINNAGSSSLPALIRSNLGVTDSG